MTRPRKLLGDAFKDGKVEKSDPMHFSIPEENGGGRIFFVRGPAVERDPYRPAAENWSL